jgi:DNA-binding response OmpR family regulator
MIAANIFVVEDDRVIRRIIELLAQRRGHRIVGFAEDAQAAVAGVDRLKPNLVLMDINLKDGTDGVSVASAIREKRNVPVIYITSQGDQSTLDRAKLTDPFGYLLKPINENELAIAIELALYRHRAEQEKERLMNELRDALAMVKKLSGILPICSYCKKIRDDQNQWEQLEKYIHTHSEADFTHGICPDCYRHALEEMKSAIPA